jgi:hypothetical protein
MVTYGSKGYIPQAADNGNYVSVITIPDGYHCKVTYLFVGATGSVTVDGKWCDGSDYIFLHAKNMSVGDIVEFGGSDGKFLVMTEGETIDIKCSSDNAILIFSYELYLAPTSTIVL